MTRIRPGNRAPVPEGWCQAPDLESPFPVLPYVYFLMGGKARRCMMPAHFSEAAMQAYQATLATHRDANDPLRACIHDLRNLFAIVASAKSLLERPLDAQKTRFVMDALDKVAAEGKIVTDALLTGHAGHTSSEGSAELQSLIPLLKTIEHPRLRIEVSVGNDRSRIPMAPSDYRAVVLELVTNARRAGARRICVRAVRRGCRYWLVVADDGAGFGSKPQRTASMQPSGLHGTGMRRLAAATHAANGKVRIRSQAGRGSIIAVILPALP